MTGDSLAKDGWTLAIRHNKKSRRRTFISHTKCQAFVKKINNEEEKRGKHSEDITKYLLTFRHRVARNFTHSVLTFLERTLNGKPMTIVRVFGIGRFESSVHSIYQLLLLQNIKEYFNVPFITSQDPLTSNNEKAYLESMNIRVLPADDLRSDPPIASDHDAFTLLYMVHCTQDMYDNVLSRYWSQFALQRLIIIGNDPHSIMTSMNSNNVQINSKQKTPYFDYFCRICTAIPLPHFEPDENAFQETAVCYFNEEDFDFPELDFDL